MGIISLKGGVGKTSVVCSLGAGLASFGKKVLLVDGNFSAPNLGLHLNVVMPEVCMQDVLARKANISNAVYDLGSFDVIFSSVSNKEKVNFFKLKEKLKILKDKYDFILIDSSPSLNEETLAVILASDELFVVSTPDHPSLSMTLKAVERARLRGMNINGLILNKTYSKDFEISLSEIEETLKTPVLAVIPYDVNVLKSLSEFDSLINYKPKSEASVEYKKLAAAICGEKFKPFRFKELFRRSPKKQEVNREVFYQKVFE